MPNYEINYLHEDGSLALKFEAQCDDDTHAKVLAHAMKDHDHKAKLEAVERWLAGVSAAAAGNAVSRSPYSDPAV